MMGDMSPCHHGGHKGYCFKCDPLWKRSMMEFDEEHGEEYDITDRLRAYIPPDAKHGKVTLEHDLEDAAQEIEDLRKKLESANAAIAQARKEALEEAAKLIESQKYMVMRPLQMYSAEEMCKAKKGALLFMADQIRRLARKKS
jgi:hypothetical protein